ncbi:TspO/MBR family protein [Candidatus Berkiella aquae]|uniref:Tryptophan-rich sensory protein n=1 Tax=Candidatus Berkiella aquae TaxID=295108 RepID=A0A0Q9YUS9_9GAMM|nr:tryptophan-rich sensory protein [Candidatus Berkiella aquae]
MVDKVIKKNRWLYCLVGITCCLSTGLISGFLSGSADSLWYRTLIKPTFNPPSWIFAPTWIVLYIMMGIALGILWEQRKKHIRLLYLFGLQFILNVCWSPMFFLMHRIDLALYVLILLWITIFTFLYQARRICSAVLLLIPYALWVSFALILNISFYMLNK